MSFIARLLDKSPSYMWQWIIAKRHTEDLMASMDIKSFDELKSFKNETLHPHYKKYFNTPYWLRKNMQRVLHLHLNKSQKKLKILDLGAGFGYFPFACEFFGHKVVGLDLPGDRLFDEACKCLDIERHHHTIQKCRPLPDNLGGPFDLITAFQICFNDHYQEKPWDVEGWEYFIDHLLEKHLNPRGRIYLELNFHHALQTWLPNDVKSLFKDKYNAKISGSSRVTITKPGA